MIGEDDLPGASTFDRSKRSLLIIEEINLSDKNPAYKKKEEVRPVIQLLLHALFA